MDFKIEDIIDEDKTFSKDKMRIISRIPLV